MTLVQARFSSYALQGRLLLPARAVLTGAGTERLAGMPGDPGTLVLTLDIPDVPDGAATVEFTYTHSGDKDPVTLTGTRWYRADGTEIDPTPGGSPPGHD